MNMNMDKKRFFSSSTRLLTDKENELQEIFDENADGKLKGKQAFNDTSEESDNSTQEEEDVIYKYRELKMDDLRKQTLKNNFDKDKMLTEKGNLTDQEILYRERVDLSDSNKDLEEDRSFIKYAKSAIYKIYNNFMPKSREYKGLIYLQDKYASFFEEEEVFSRKNINEKGKELEDLDSYFDDELKGNQAVRNQLKKRMGELPLKKNTEFKRKFDTIREESENSSKKSRQSETDFFTEEIPYNPFDDLD